MYRAQRGIPSRERAVNLAGVPKTGPVPDRFAGVRGSGIRALLIVDIRETSLCGEGIPLDDGCWDIGSRGEKMKEKKIIIHGTRVGRRGTGGRGEKTKMLFRG